MKNEIGHYIVNGKIYSNKFDAVLHAQQTNSNIEWYFFDEVFNKVNWHVEPQLSIDELYKIRAQQIREKYDYIIVFCSGGSDSNNVIRTFINNNIHVDEVMALAPTSGLNNWNFDKNNTNEDNTISEIKFALFPILEEIKTKSPKTKITVNDYFENIIKQNDEYWVHDSCGDIVTVLTSHFTDINKFQHIDRLIEQGKRVALVYGSDKPIIRTDMDDNLYYLFSDSGINYLNMPTYRQRPNLDRVLFYWTPDLPEMLVKQAHIVAKALTLPENKSLKELLRLPLEPDTLWSFEKFNKFRIDLGKQPITKEQILKNKLPNGVMTNHLLQFNNRSTYQRLIVPYIYPTTYTNNLFQCQKVNVDEGFFTKDQSWVHVLHKNSKISEMIISGTKSLYNLISPKYLNKYGTCFNLNIKSYKYGNLKDFTHV